MYAIECSQFNSGMLAHYLTTQLGRMGKASGLALLLLARVNWKQDGGDYGPHGTINHLTVGKMADALKCSPSTVHDHLAILRKAGIIGTEPVTDARGSILYCRIWFSGFVSWLLKSGTPNTAPPSNRPSGGGSEKPETYHNLKHQKIIDLEQVKSVRFSELESLIQEAAPRLSSGERADPQMVYERFRSYNLGRGNTRISLSALKGFAKKFTDFRSKRDVRPTPPVPFAAPAVAPTLTVPMSDLNPIQIALKAKYPELFGAWFASLKFVWSGQDLKVEAPSTFHRNYISTHYENAICAAAGPGVRVAFA